MRTGIIYRAENKVTGKSYVGQTIVALVDRIRNHYCAAEAMANGRYKLNSRFARALRKYGRQDWLWSVLCEMGDSDLNQAECDEIKRHNAFRAGYNSTPGGDFNPMSVPELAAKCSTSKKGAQFSDAHRAKLAAAKRGVPRSEETRRRIGAASKGNKYGLGHRCSEKNRLASVQRSQGSGNASAKLTESSVLEIRQRYANGESEKQLALRFGIHRGTVNCIVRRVTWKHVKSGAA